MIRRDWTPDDDEVLRKMVLEGRSPTEIALELERSISAVKARAHRLGISLGFYKPKYY
jgi:DNA-directed RNA polymerase specialized sigma24 family protein